jgi:hypothetical protein
MRLLQHFVDHVLTQLQLVHKLPGNTAISIPSFMYADTNLSQPATQLNKSAKEVKQRPMQEQEPVASNAGLVISNFINNISIDDISDIGKIARNKHSELSTSAQASAAYVASLPILKQLSENDILPDAQEMLASSKSKVRVLFARRRPYSGHPVVGRQIDNENNLLDAFRALSDVETVTSFDFAAASIQEQMKAVAEHDVLMGMHGAG